MASGWNGALTALPLLDPSLANRSLLQGTGLLSASCSVYLKAAVWLTAPIPAIRPDLVASLEQTTIHLCVLP